MKYFRLSLSVSLLTVLLALTALAGDMPCPVNAPAPVAGEMPYPVAAYTDAVTEIALSVFQSVLSLF